MERSIGMCIGAEGNGCFVIAELCEALVEGDGGDARKRVRGWFGENVVKQVEAVEAKGKKVLLEKVKKL